MLGACTHAVQRRVRCCVLTSWGHRIVSHWSARVGLQEAVAASGVTNDVELELLLARLESLMDRRPFLVNDVLLRQNPNNVLEWQKRVKLHGDNAEQVVATYTKAVTTIDPRRAVGSLPQLWSEFAHFYADGDDLESARAVYERAVKVAFKNVDDLAQVWCDYAEMEIGAAYGVLACSPPPCARFFFFWGDPLVISSAPLS